MQFLEQRDEGKFLKIGDRYILVGKNKRNNIEKKRDALGKIIAACACRAAPHNANKQSEHAFFSGLNASTLSDAEVNEIWSGLKSMQERGMFKSHNPI